MTDELFTYAELRDACDLAIEYVSIHDYASPHAVDAAIREIRESRIPDPLDPNDTAALDAQANGPSDPTLWQRRYLAVAEDARASKARVDELARRLDAQAVRYAALVDAALKAGAGA